MREQYHMFLSVARSRSIRLVLMVAALVCTLLGRAHAADGSQATGRAPDLARPSPLELVYSERAGMTLRQFGYELFAVRPPGTPRPLGAVEGEFILGIGDQLEITLRGLHSATRRYTVDTAGRLLVDQLRPILAAGRRLDDLRAELEAEVAATLPQTEVYLSLAEVRRIDVIVAGAVAAPGRHVLTAYSTVLDALYAAGGVTRLGSLRQIRLVRGADSREVDLYGLALGMAGDADPRLRDGDRIVVPPLGPILAVAGAVRRPGIFELPAHQPTLSLPQALALAAGPLWPGPLRALRLTIAPDGSESWQEIRTADAAALGNGDLLLIDPVPALARGVVTLEGQVRRPGPRALDAGATLARVLDVAEILPDTYPLFAVIERFDRDRLMRRFIPFTPRGILAGTEDRVLADGDRIHLFALPVLQTAEAAPAEPTTPEDAPETAVPLSAAGAGPPPLDPALQHLVQDRLVTLHGAVAAPGRYPVAGPVPLVSLIETAGGLVRDADPGAVEITTGTAVAGQSPRRLLDLTAAAGGDIHVAPEDAVRIGWRPVQVAAHAVTIAGEVIRPGRYDLVHGETLSGLIARAGGLTDHAYAAGAIFTRESARRREADLFARAALELERGLALALLGDSPPPADEVELARSLVNDLRAVEPLGRITVEADPAILARHPELDILLEPGDRIYIPKRPLTVTVTGEVLAPASLQFRAGKTADDYLREAGGFTRLADADRAFVLLPDGSARPLRVSAWHHEPTLIPPGATLVVPRDPEPFDFLAFSQGIGGLLSQLALTAASISVLRD